MSLLGFFLSSGAMANQSSYITGESRWVAYGYLSHQEVLPAPISDLTQIISRWEGPCEAVVGLVNTLHPHP